MMERGIAVVVEDDDEVRALLAEILSQSGFAVHPTASGHEGVEAVRIHNPDIVTMDVGLPDFDGLEASRRIRTFSDAYVIIVTGYVDEADALMGFEAGADDYLTKPFRPRELRARIGAMLRRPRIITPAPVRAVPGGPSVPAPAQPHAIVVSAEPVPPAEPGEAPVCCDFAHRGLTLHEDSRLAAINGVPVDLTRTQFDLLLVLMENGRTVQTKADLVRRLRNEPYDTGSFVSAGEERAVEVHLGNLRKRLGDSSRRPRWVETVRGVGYRMTP
ncbi:DNA-binding response regulator, OmpR family, contains REC and winged-helix (wHTH) domain [Pseudarthrobacter equi]|uniref:DNA-binding response regulator, OmpR family, contains REC and winged-helix (WHTH) domain n=1 Tax=Pseudarthrobacter equi TaxID=728066 RepID=A0A1H2BN34_9MICC|nr:response regulator transcription factor [Pseudarthrobacter equi]SDT59477.1 DNA-binding response regulator, OmpR family, contains REC and winged-helix (wHTH) domain [Pseudarthrobacter equi]